MARSSKYPLLEFIQEREREAKELLFFYQRLKNFIERWRQQEDVLKVLYACPPASILESVVHVTKEYTDIPPSISFFAMLCLMGAKATQKGFGVWVGTQVVRPNLWVLTLAPSGTGKTYAISQICLRAINGDVEMLPQTSTAAGLVKLLADHPNKAAAILLRDEMAQLFKMLRKDAYIDLKDFLLRSYDGGTIERHTKKDGLIRVANVFISIYGTTVLETFARSLKDEDLMDGFMQRFMVHIAEKRDKIVPLYVIPDCAMEEVRRKWKKFVDVLDSRESKTLPLTERAKKLYERWFIENFDRALDSYYRRYMFSAIKIGLIYALLKGSVYVDEECIGWSIRVVTMCLDSLYKLMQEYLSFDEYDSLIRRVERYIKEHPGCTRRDIVRNVYGIRTVKQLEAVLEIIALRSDMDVSHLLKPPKRGRKSRV